MKSRFIVVLAVSALFLALTAGALSAAAQATDFANVPAKGTVTMIDLGADSCIPCKMMAGTLVKLRKLYKGKAAIIFIDVWKNREQAGRFGVRLIPTQIFFDADGEEVHRHVGFMAEADIVAQLKEMGVEL
ncbi:MAG: thioredoxin family protein [Syntrophales bacterium]|nr:thioredoxin family protein [Syntrophales bacterium]